MFVRSLNLRLLLLIALGFILRVASIKLANLYHGNEVFYIGADTPSWMLAVENFFKHGVYSINLNSEWGYFGRMPGYSIYLGFFYVLTGLDWDLALKMAVAGQIVLDTISIYFVYSISSRIFNNVHVALINAFLYTTYPFIIIWNPILFSEATSVFWLLLGIWWILKKPLFYTFLSGLAFSMAAFTRPQLICIFPLLLLVIAWKNQYHLKHSFVSFFIYGSSLLIFYGAWPARNYFGYNKLVLTQDIKAFPYWDTDVSALLKYIYSVTTEWEPHFTQIICTEQKIEFPHEAYAIPADSLLLMQTIQLCRECGSGFGQWKALKGCGALVENDCNQQIDANFNQLLLSQKQNHPFNYYVALPLKNLQKALLKTSINTDNTTKKMVSYALFSYRTLCILLGFVGIILVFLKREDNYNLAKVTLIFFLLVYGILCFGPTEQMRNIEMRYFLQPDVLFLFFVGKVFVRNSLT